MSLTTWAADIILEAKRIFKIDHAATEQEVHETLRGVKAGEEIESAVRAEFEKQITDLQAQVTELQDGTQALQSAVAVLEGERDTLQANLSALETDKADLEKQLADAQAEIGKLKETLADTHTGGEPGGGLARAYEKNPMNKQYLKNRAARNA
jgi:septal ring factor EnvC (AmiA/AmiB activator)